MANSGEEQVMAALLTRLEGITQANGFETDVEHVIRVDQEPTHLGTGPRIVILQGDTSYNHREAGHYVAATMFVLLELSFELVDVAQREALTNSFLADVQKQLAVLDGTELEDLVYDVTWDRASRFVSGDDTVVAGATLRVSLFTRLGREDPFTLFNCS